MFDRFCQLFLATLWKNVSMLKRHNFSPIIIKNVKNYKLDLCDIRSKSLSELMARLVRVLEPKMCRVDITDSSPYLYPLSITVPCTVSFCSLILSSSSNHI